MDKRPKQWIVENVEDTVTGSYEFSTEIYDSRHSTFTAANNRLYEEDGRESRQEFGDWMDGGRDRMNLSRARWNAAALLRSSLTHCLSSSILLK